MIVVPCQQTTFFDVDETLLMWYGSPEDLAEYGVWVTSPVSEFYNEDGLQKTSANKQLLLPHRKHIEQLKQHKFRGHTIIVWSAGGWDWAEAAVKALGLEKYVDLVISKPIWFYDDLPCQEFMGKRYYFDDKTEVENEKK
jgi:hypothetical protein